VLVGIWAAYSLALVSVPRYDLPGVVAFGAFPVFAALGLGVPLGPIFKRLGLLSPFVLLMAAANPVFDRAPVATPFGTEISAGWVSGTVILLKGLLSIGSVLVMVAVLPFYRLCSALRGLRVPEAFVTQLALLYRYALLLASEAASLRKARDLRSFGRRGKGLFATARLIGSLLLRTVDRAGRVHRAMLARGFTGTLHHTPADARPRAVDLLLLAAALAAFITVRLAF
jgi:cobalt/nickel transport system permease protein